ncbi:MAG TPA: SRPBCC family protein [Polyangiaceae bacterium]|jgi:hypothetical protein|nr:SRPBCC family protein [Polyangiaceae bacterium]
MHASPKTATAKAGPAARAFVELPRSLSDVRALFFDVDLAVRTRLHQGVRFRWLPRGCAGERRLCRLTRVLGRIHREEIVVEEGADGTWVKRFVKGPNEGTRFVAQFVALGDAGTCVTLEAFPGPRGFAQGLGPLSPLGLEKALQRILGDYQRALEKYVPGRARGRVVDALIDMGAAVARLRNLDSTRQLSVVTALLETAWAIAVVNGPPDDAERDAMRAVAGVLCQNVGEPTSERHMIQTAIDAVAKQGVAARCTALGTRLKSFGFGEFGVEVAALVADVSHGIDTPELMALEHLAVAAGLDNERLAAIVRRTEELLLGGDRVSRMSMVT